MTKNNIRGDRRVQRRYPIELDLEYKVMKGGAVVSAGSARTDNMSSGGVLFQTDEDLAHGQSVELMIRWPSVLSSAPFIQLWGFGRVVRSDANGTAVQLNRFQFQRLGDSRVMFEQFPAHATIQ